MRNPLDIYPWRVRNPLEVAEVRNNDLCICSTGTEGLVSRENLFHDIGTVAGKPFSGNGGPAGTPGGSPIETLMGLLLALSFSTLPSVSRLPWVLPI